MSPHSERFHPLRSPHYPVIDTKYSTQSEHMMGVFFNFISALSTLLFPIRTDMALCKFYGSGFQSHLSPAIFSSTKTACFAA